MFFWLLWTTIFLAVSGFFLQSVILYMRSRRRQGPGRAKLQRHVVLAPEFVALQSQFFLAPTAAVKEARAIALLAGAPRKLFEDKLDDVAFYSALVELQAYRPDALGVSHIRRRV